MKKRLTALIAAAAALLVTSLIAGGALFRVDKWTQDYLFQRPRAASRDILIIGIDETALAALGPYHTWDRTVMASALEALAADPAKLPAAVAVDVLYSGDTAPEADARLAQAAQSLGCVVTASMAQFGSEVIWQDGRAVGARDGAVVGYVEPYAALRNAAVQGHINAMADTDGVLRHALLYVDTPSGRVFSMAAETARLYLAARGESLSLPASSSGHVYVPFSGKSGAYSDGVSLSWLIEGKVPPDYWAGKIVLIGPYAPQLQDAYFTPIDKGHPMYGVEYQANVIQSLIDGNAKKELPHILQVLLTAIVLVLSALLFVRLRPLPGGSVCLCVALSGLAGCVVLYHFGWIAHPLWLPAGALILYAASLVWHYILTAREKKALALEKERIQAELDLATRIQVNALPKEYPPFPDRKEFDVYASMKPAREVGGDLYDFFLMDDDHLALVIGDVSGKGVPAALFMMVSLTLIHHVAMSEKSPARILQIVNSEMCARNPEDMFVTVWMGVLEISTGRLTCANAGHEYPALQPSGGAFDLVRDKHGLVIGGMDGVRYREYELSLTPGSKLFVYTDGVPEATNAQQQLFGTDRMVSALQAAPNGRPEDILSGVHNAVSAFVGDAEQFDDITMLCLAYHGAEA